MFEGSQEPAQELFHFWTVLAQGQVGAHAVIWLWSLWSEIIIVTEAWDISLRCNHAV